MYYCVCDVCVGGYCAPVHVWIEDSFVGLVLFFHLYVGSGDKARVSRLYLLIHLPSRKLSIS